MNLSTVSEPSFCSLNLWAAQMIVQLQTATQYYY